ncbi:hypothetical protein KIN20_037320 [Parelaphostrongylus tenuis]|uniref:Uncharacterized protein n=1 Tax=Parelaphostrongylus tenuis TaxID=148309 RepID=A0AAD5RE40_PARTN|nr:hypothetical protein KIN20_037320 [Parelaphostrongylus tenuis]
MAFIGCSCMWTIAPYERSRNKRITKSPTVIDLTKDEPEEIVPSDSDTNESDETGRCSSLDGFAITMNPSETAFCSSLKEAEQLAVRNTKWLLLSITTGDQKSVEILEADLFNDSETRHALLSNCVYLM